MNLRIPPAKSQGKDTGNIKKTIWLQQKTFIPNNHSMPEWVKANPKQAKNKIDSQFFLFREVDIDEKTI